MLVIGNRDLEAGGASVKVHGKRQPLREADR